MPHGSSYASARREERASEQGVSSSTMTSKLEKDGREQRNRVGSDGESHSPGPRADRPSDSDFYPVHQLVQAESRECDLLPRGRVLSRPASHDSLREGRENQSHREQAESQRARLLRCPRKQLSQNHRKSSEERKRARGPEA